MSLWLLLINQQIVGGVHKQDTATLHVLETHECRKIPLVGGEETLLAKGTIR